MHPPHQPKPNESGRKIIPNFGEELFFFFFFGDHLIVGEKNVWISEFGQKITLNIGEDFFFFFGDHLILGEKNVWISEFGRNITLNFGEDIRIFEVLCLKSPPPKFSRSATVCSLCSRAFFLEIIFFRKNIIWTRVSFLLKI